MSSAWSATMCFSLPFSSLSRRNSLASSAFMPVLVAPAGEGMLADAELFGHLGHVLALAEQPVRFPQLAHDLLRRVLPALHPSSSLPSRAVVEPSYHVDQFSGVRSAVQRSVDEDLLEAECFNHNAIASALFFKPFDR